MRTAHLALAASVLLAPADAALAGTVTIVLPRLSIAEYKKPYLAGWIEPASGGAARTLFAWYDVRKGGAEGGTKWLSDLRSWWRKSGRALKMPADGISGATRGPGSYTIPLPTDLAAGSYILSVEAARENGGRDVVSIPISVPAASGRAAGKTELGSVTVSAK